MSGSGTSGGGEKFSATFFSGAVSGAVSSSGTSVVAGAVAAVPAGTRTLPAARAGVAAGIIGPENSMLVADRNSPVGVKATEADATAERSAVMLFNVSLISLHTVENLLASLDPLLISSQSSVPIFSHVGTSKAAPTVGIKSFPFAQSSKAFKVDES